MIKEFYYLADHAKQEFGIDQALNSPPGTVW